MNTHPKFLSAEDIITLRKRLRKERQFLAVDVLIVAFVVAVIVLALYGFCSG